MISTRVFARVSRTATGHAWWLLPPITAALAVAVNFATDRNSWPWWVLVVGLTAAAAGVGRHVSATAGDTASELDLRREGNPRFGFWFSYPSGWARADPENGDGNAYVDPANVAVKVAFWGGHNVEGISDLAKCRQLAEADGTVLDSRQAGGRLRRPTDQGYAYTQIPGWRVIAVAPSQDGMGTTHFQQYFDAGERIVGFHARAPTAVYSTYLPLFRRLVEDIAINEGHRPG